jgi:hypothetical protein
MSRTYAVKNWIFEKWMTLVPVAAFAVTIVVIGS